MAHEIDNTKGFNAMAYVGDKPWHGLGQQMKKGQSIEQWQTAAGMDFEIHQVPALYQIKEGGFTHKIPNKKVLVRSDSGTSLSVVSDTYNVVQPKEVLEFYRDLTASAGFELETAGVLKGGAKYWALASIGQEARLLDDTIKGYLLLGTACDGTMATTAMFTSIRVVCNNTLGFAMQEAKGKTKHLVRVNHRSVFDQTQVKAQLGLAASSWDSFIKSVDVWASTSVSNEKALQYFEVVMGYEDPNVPGVYVPNKKATSKLMELYNGAGKGAGMKTAKNTVWGLINAVTEYVDHHRGRITDNRLDRALFGDGVGLKNKAITTANDLLLV